MHPRKYIKQLIADYHLSDGILFKITRRRIGTITNMVNSKTPSRVSNNDISYHAYQTYMLLAIKERATSSMSI
jgi:hypothetical protein